MAQSKKVKIDMPKIIDKEAKKLEILQAAMKVFAQKGVANTKIADIATAANIGKGTIYEYFKNKDEIFEQGYHHYMEIMETAIAKEIFKTTDPVEKLRTLFVSWVDILMDNSTHFHDFLEIMLDFWAEAVRQKDKQRMKIIDLEKIYNDYRKLIISILEEGIRLGKFKKVNTFYTASLMVGALDGIMLQWILNRSYFNMKEAIECLMDELLHGIYIS